MWTLGPMWSFSLVITVALWDLTGQVSTTDTGETIAFVTAHQPADAGERELNYFPETLDVDVEYGEKVKTLRLVKHERPDARKLKESSLDGSVIKPKRHVAWYQDVDNMADIMVEVQPNDGRLERSLTGTIFLDSKAFKIKPASKSLKMLEDVLSERGLRSHDSHMMHVLKEVELQEVPKFVVQDRVVTTATVAASTAATSVATTATTEAATTAARSAATATTEAATTAARSATTAATEAAATSATTVTTEAATTAATTAAVPTTNTAAVTAATSEAATTAEQITLAPPPEECIPLHWACDGWGACYTGGDEDFSWCQSLSCPSGYATCPGKATTGQIECIPETFACDGEQDCYFSNDETLSWCQSNGYIPSCYAKDYILCPLNVNEEVECIYKTYPCDGIQDCYYSNDENITWCGSLGITPKCYDTASIPCPVQDDTFKCIHWSYTCDMYPDCDSGSDEDREFCTNMTCPEGMTRCPFQDGYGTVQCIDSSYICDGYVDCEYEMDEDVEWCQEQGFLEPQCYDSNMESCPISDTTVQFECIHKTYFCDGYQDCVGGMDENRTWCLTNQKTPKCYDEDKIVCPTVDADGKVVCLRADWACDGIEDCPQRGDETLDYCSDLVCPSLLTYCPPVANCTPFDVVCDESNDCIGDVVEIPTWCFEDCPAGMIYCPTNTIWNQCLRYDGVCDEYRNCYGNDEDPLWCATVPERTCDDGYISCPELPSLGVTECINETYPCDGYTDCDYTNDENITWCLTNDHPVHCFDEGYIPCPYDRYSLAVQCINGTYPCDGIRDCIEYSDENVTWCFEQGITPKCFHEDLVDCLVVDENGDVIVQCVPKIWVCEDPENCYPEIKCKDLTCRDGWFACPNLGTVMQCVNETYICDGICDCYNCTEENMTWCAEQNIPLQCYYTDNIPCPLSNDFSQESMYFQCIPKPWACDGIVDCPGETDEDFYWCMSHPCDDYFVPCPLGGQVVLSRSEKVGRSHPHLPGEGRRMSMRGEGHRARDRSLMRSGTVDDLETKEMKKRMSEIEARQAMEGVNGNKGHEFTKRGEKPHRERSKDADSHQRSSDRKASESKRGSAKKSADAKKQDRPERASERVKRGGTIRSERKPVSP